MSPAKAKESMVLIGLSLITIIAMFSDPAKAYPDRVWILKEEDYEEKNNCCNIKIYYVDILYLHADIMFYLLYPRYI